MKLFILYDNEAKKGYKKGWGFSCLVGDNLLFDVGADYETLRYNINNASIELDSIDKIVLSHQHKDHIGGINIIDDLADVEVFLPISFPRNFKQVIRSYPNTNLIEVDESVEICEGIYTTGELGDFTKEQSLVIKTVDGLLLLTGCSHPGLENILNEASKLGEPYGAIGGFHGFNKLEVLEDLELIVPCHCTKYKKKILTLYPNKSIICSVGCVFNI